MDAFDRVVRRLDQWFRWIQPLEPTLVFAGVPQAGRGRGAKAHREIFDRSETRKKSPPFKVKGTHRERRSRPGDSR